jgi:hypothetical protein
MRNASRSISPNFARDPVVGNTIPTLIPYSAETGPPTIKPKNMKTTRTDKTFTKLFMNYLLFFVV